MQEVEGRIPRISDFFVKIWTTNASNTTSGINAFRLLLTSYFCEGTYDVETAAQCGS